MDAQKLQKLAVSLLRIDGSDDSFLDRVNEYSVALEAFLSSESLSEEDKALISSLLDAHSEVLRYLSECKVCLSREIGEMQTKGKHIRAYLRYEPGES